jgi:hypothetical protein
MKAACCDVLEAAFIDFVDLADCALLGMFLFF